MKILNIKKGWHTASIIWALIIFILSILPGSAIKKIWTIEFFSMDKIAHWGVYFVFAVLLWKSFEMKGFLKPNFQTILVASTFGILMELVQYLFFPYRYFDLFDIIANIIGSTFGAVVINFLTHKKQ